MRKGRARGRRSNRNKRAKRLGLTQRPSAATFTKSIREQERLFNKSREIEKRMGWKQKDLTTIQPPYWWLERWERENGKRMG